MILSLVALDLSQQERQFTCWLNSDEVAFDFLNQIVAAGHKLLSVGLTEEELTTYLPVDAFDGHLVSDQLLHLQTQWTSILAKSNRNTASSMKDNRTWCQDRLDRIEKQLVHIELMITRLHMAILDLARNEDQFLIRQIDRYYKVLDHYEAQLPHIYQIRSRLLDCLLAECLIEQ